jgi:hypoxanthine phosphoribosyltransferase
MTESRSESTGATPVLGEGNQKLRVMYTAEQIRERVRQMGLEVARDLGGLTRSPIYVGVLKGACMFQCDLARATPLDVELDFISVSSYGTGTSSSGHVKLIAGLRNDIAGRHVVVCEGVVDSGMSLQFILEHLRNQGPASVKVATLLDKVPCRKIHVPVDHAGWRIRDEFVVGYGMDVAERHRNLPFVGVFEEA